MGILPFPSASPKHLDGTGNEVDLRNKSLFDPLLVLEVGGGGRDDRLLLVLDIGEGVDLVIMRPGRSDACNEAGGVRDPLRGVEVPFLGGDVVDKEEPNRDMVRDKMGGKGPSGALRELEPPEFLEGVSPRGEVDFGLGVKGGDLAVPEVGVDTVETSRTRFAVVSSKREVRVGRLVDLP